MSILTSGVVLWYLGHLFKRLFPNARARMGNAGKGIIAVVILTGVVLMVIGYRGLETIPFYDPPAWGWHANNALMLVSVFLFGLGHSKSPLRSRMRHPMLTGTLLWAIAHLLVNGDLASVFLFGSLGIWTLFEMRLINLNEPDYDRFKGGTAAGTVRLIVITLAVYAAIAGIHTWLGYYPFAA